jgi:hypothetical protein
MKAQRGIYEKVPAPMFGGFAMRMRQDASGVKRRE